MSKAELPTVRSRRLGAKLRQLREDQDLTTIAAARLLNRSNSSISKLESGHRGVFRPALENMLDKYGLIDPAARENLFKLARVASQRGWWQDYDGMLSPETMDLISLEAESTLIEFLELVIIPGLLQTEAYTRAILELGPFAADLRRLEKMIKIRTKRQEIIAKSDPPKVWAILDEAALHRQVGGADVMRAQKQHLLEITELNHVTLQIIPYAVGTHWGVGGAFKILHFGRRDDLPVVAVDSLSQIDYREEEGEVKRYVQAFNHLRAAALSESDSRAFLQRLLSKT
jgi:transcriptional regulator with XRE-family HTH domain